MRRRLTAAMILMVLATLVLSGLVGLAFAARNIGAQTRRELVREAQELAASVPQEAATASHSDSAKSLRGLLLALRSPLRLDGSALVAVRPNGALFDPAEPRSAVELPGGLKPSDLHPPSLLDLQTVSGQSGRLVYAAAPNPTAVMVAGTPRQVVLVVVLTRRAPSALASAGPWLLLSGVAILAAAGLVAHRLGRRFVRPIRAAQEVTSRIAAGDLDARVPPPPRTDPELAALADSVNAMAAALARSQQAERHFLQSVSHELRTPLTSIRGFAEAIEDGATADTVAAAGVIAAEARRLERLVGDLLALAALEARRFSLQLADVDLAAAVGEAVAGFGPTAAELGLQLGMKRPRNAVWATADADRVAQVVANLIENALRHASSAVGVGVGAGRSGPELWVTDDGPGIPADVLARVFDRLFSARSRPGRPIGSGLGLSIVAELVSAMGGTVQAESPVDGAGGTRVVVTLPRAGRTRARRKGSRGNDPPSTSPGSEPTCEYIRRSSLDGGPCNGQGR